MEFGLNFSVERAKLQRLQSARVGEVNMQLRESTSILSVKINKQG